jgi:hypothetical protein
MSVVYKEPRALSMLDPAMVPRQKRIMVMKRFKDPDGDLLVSMLMIYQE